MPEKEKTETEVLFPEVDVEGYRIRPWSFGQFAKLMPVFRSIMIDVKKAGLILGDIEGKTEQDVEKDAVEMVPEIMELAAPYAPVIIAITLGVSENEVESWDMVKGTTILLTIITQNVDYLKNSSGLGTVMKVLNTSLLRP